MGEAPIIRRKCVWLSCGVIIISSLDKTNPSYDSANKSRKICIFCFSFLNKTKNNKI